MDEPLDMHQLMNALSDSLCPDPEKLTKAKTTLDRLSTQPDSFLQGLVKILLDTTIEYLHHSAAVVFKNKVPMCWCFIPKESQEGIRDAIFKLIFTAQSRTLARILVQSLLTILATLDDAQKMTPVVINEVHKALDEGDESRVILALRALKACSRVFTKDEYLENLDAQAQLQNIFTGAVHLVDMCTGTASFAMLKILTGILRYIVTACRTSAALFSSSDNVSQLHQTLLQVIREDERRVTSDLQLLFWKAKARAVQIWEIQVEDCFDNAAGNEQALQAILLQTAPAYVQELLVLLSRPSLEGPALSDERRAFVSQMRLDQCIAAVLSALTDQVCRREVLAVCLTDHQDWMNELATTILPQHLGFNEHDEMLLSEDPINYSIDISDEVIHSLPCEHGEEAFDDCEPCADGYGGYEFDKQISARSCAMRFLRHFIELGGETSLSAYLEFLEMEFLRSTLSNDNMGSQLGSMITHRIALTRALLALLPATIQHKHTCLPKYKLLLISQLIPETSFASHPLAIHLRSISVLSIGWISRTFLSIHDLDIWMYCTRILLERLAESEFAVRESTKTAFLHTMCTGSEELLKDVAPRIMDVLAEQIVKLGIDEIAIQTLDAFVACLNLHRGRFGRPPEGEMSEDEAVATMLRIHRDTIRYFREQLSNVLRAMEVSPNRLYEQFFGAYINTLQAITGGLPYQSSQAILDVYEEITNTAPMLITAQVYNLSIKQFVEAELLDLLGSIRPDGENNSLVFLHTILDVVDQLQEAADGLVSVVPAHVLAGGPKLLLSQRNGTSFVARALRHFTLKANSDDFEQLYSCTLLRICLLGLILVEEEDSLLAKSSYVRAQQIIQVHPAVAESLQSIMERVVHVAFDCVIK
eukprot:gene10719-2810_t